MNNILKQAMAAALVCITGAAALAIDGAVPAREHRAIWVSPMLAEWPTADATAGNKAGQLRNLENRMKKFKDQNINVLYYHVRSNCDANYRSTLEPWSTGVSSARGVEPDWDPFEMYIEYAHKYGIEVYAWVNPYRYSENKSWGDHPLNYENSHPDWLIKNSNQTILNPALPEVKQRIVDVITEIITNYDVDGVVFDDYFYPQGGMATDSSAPDYALWQQTGAGQSIGDWRRGHINDMVHRVGQAIKAVKPYLPFGISPAGVSSPPNVTTEYGLPSVSGDWQYNQIYSDPLAWLRAGDIDFISAQVYWPNRWTELSRWWDDAARKFGRHSYPSTSVTAISDNKAATYISEVNDLRQYAAEGTTGIVYFSYKQFINYRESNKEFGVLLHDAVYPTKALTPLRPWNNVYAPAMVGDVAVADGQLTWTAVPGMRYVVYAHSKTEVDPFVIDVADIHGISYTNSYTLPADYDGYDWYVAVYDRYGNEYSPIGVGQTQTTAAAPQLVYPAEGETPLDVFDFSWSADLAGKFTVEVATDADFANIVATASTGARTLSSTVLGKLEGGKTHWWRVRHNPVGAMPVVSEARSFVAARLQVVSPAPMASGVSLTPTLGWTKSADGTQYTVELSLNEGFTDVVYTTQTTATEVTVPARKLTTGTKYWARVSAESAGADKRVSDAVTFTTIDKADYAAPVFVNPAADNAVMHSDEYITVSDFDGMVNVQVQICASESFGSRATTNIVLNDFNPVATTAMGDVKGSVKALVDGKTYYLRARGAYRLTTASGLQYTDYSAVRPFVYSSAAGVDDITSDAAGVSVAAGSLTAPAGTAVAVYTVDGRLVARGTAANGNYALPAAPGVYLLRLTLPAASTPLTLKYTR